MRIAFFTQYSSLNGTYFRWHNLAIALKDAGHEVDVYAGDHNWKSAVRYEQRDGIDYYLVPALQSARIFYSPNDPLSSLRRLLKLPGRQYDVYHLFQPFLQAYVPWNFLRRRKERNAIFVYDWDDLWTGGLYNNPVDIRQRYMAAVTKYLEKKIPQKAEGITVCSQFLADKITEKRPVHRIYNGFWPKPQPDKTVLRKKWDLKPDQFYLGYVGKTADELHWIIEGIQSLHKKGYTNTSLIICGPPRAYLEEKGVLSLPYVRYLGELSPTEAGEISASVDLGMIPLENNLFNQSRFPIKFFDFVTVGTPVFLSAVGEIAIIAKQVTGAFTGPANKEAWVSELTEVVQNLQQNPVTIDVENLKKQFSWPALAQALLSFYTTVQQEKN